MLLLENLDDRTFKDIIENAGRAISRLNSEWTDENYHDPGITLLELLAWMTEIQQYRLDRITRRSELKFLRILGEKPREAVPSQTLISCSVADEGFTIPEGAQFTTEHSLTFETMRRFTCYPLIIEKVMVVSGRDTVDFTSPNRYSRSGYPAFGREAKKGNRLLIGLSGPAPEGLSLNIYLDLFDDYPVAGGNWDHVEPAFLPSAQLSWRYFGRDEQGGAWLPLPVLRDDTIQLSKDGILEVMVDSPMEPLKINPANDKPRYWLQCEVVEEGFEIAPRLNQIVLNAVNAIQKETLSRQEDFPWDGGPDPVILTHFLHYYGINRLQVQSEDGCWYDWNQTEDSEKPATENETYYIERNPGEKSIRLLLSGLGAGESHPLINKNIRVISCLPDFYHQRLIGKGSGLPNQVFSLPDSLKGVQGLRIQIGKPGHSRPGLAWEDWTQVEDLDASGPDDRHFVLDPDQGVIYFGNDERGAIPEASDLWNVCITACSTTAGANGNIKENNVFDIRIGDYPRPLRVTNAQRALGGRDAESLEAAKERLRREYFQPAKAVTLSDYEELARQTPGVRIAYARAIPCFAPNIPGPAAGQVSVVAVPYSDKDRPMPSRNLLKNVQQHLEQYRLIGTRIHVIPPEYIKISVRGIVMVQTRNFSRQRMLAALDNMLQPFDLEQGRSQRDFRGTVVKSDVLSLLNRVPGVEYVSELWLQAEGGGRVTAGGDIELPPYGLPAPGSYEIEIKDVNE